LIAVPSVSPLQQLRDQRHRDWLTALQQQLGEALASERADSALWAIHLFGSRARGDWDGFSDTDLLVVGCDQPLAEQLADRLRSAGLGDDVVAMDQSRWSQLTADSSPYWCGVARDARRLMGDLP